MTPLSPDTQMERLRKAIEDIYLRRLPNPDTGLYDIKSSIDDLIELYTSEVAASNRELLTKIAKQQFIATEETSFSGEIGLVFASYIEAELTRLEAGTEGA